MQSHYIFLTALPTFLHRIIIVINLEIVVEKSEPIGEPKPYVDAGTASSGQSSSMNQPGVGATNHQPYGGPSTGFGSSEHGKVGILVCIQKHN